MTVPSRDDLASALADRYTIERELGAGGMAVVYLARDLRHDRRVALKVLRPELAATVGHQRFLQEIRVTANLQHPHILPLFDSGTAAEQLFYVMPFLEGDSLRARLSGGKPLAMGEVLRILSDVAEALQYAHAHGVIHRDIKPDNVLFSGDAAVVSDFGIGKALSAARVAGGAGPITQTGMSIGTPAYMAPEQAAGDAATDHRADIYSFGCLAYELLSGRTPFEAATPQRMLAGHLSEIPKPVAELRPDTPAPLAELVMRCLQKEAVDRPARAAELSALIAGVRTGSGPLALPAVLVAGPKAFWRALGIYLVAVIALVGCAVVLTRSLGLPDWVVPGAVFLGVLGLPVILFTGYVQHATRKALATSAWTPGGSQGPPGTMATLAIRAAPRLTWKRTLLGGLGAAGGLAVLTAAYMGMREWGIGPVGTLVAKRELNPHPLLLIADVTVKSADPSLGSAVAEGVRAVLAESRALRLLSPADRNFAVRATRRNPDSTRVDLTLAQELAARTGATAIVDGELTGIENGFILTIRLVSADSARVLATVQETARPRDELIPAVDAVARKLRSRIGESLKSVRASPPLGRITTSSLEALRLYTNNPGTGPVRIARLRQILTIDPEFGSAWRSLAIAMSNASYPQSAIDSASTRAYELRDRMSDRERYVAESMYFLLGPGADRRRGIEAQEGSLRAGDSGWGALNNLGLSLKSRRDWNGALRYLLQSAQTPRPPVNPFYNLPGPLLALGRIEAAESVLVEGRKPGRFPLDNGLVMHTAALLYHRGKLEEYERAVDSLRNTSGPFTRLSGAVASAEVAWLRGRLADADRHRAMAAEKIAELNLPQVPLRDSIRAAQADIWFRGKPERGVARLDAALAQFPLQGFPLSDRPYTALAVTYARAGRADKARDLLARLERETKGTPRGALLRTLAGNARGEIALAERRPQDAIIEFRRADMLPDGPVDDNPIRVLANLGRAFDQAEEPDSAIAYFEKYLATPYWFRIRQDQNRQVLDYEPTDAIFRAHVVRRLGELYETKGDTRNAARYLREFVSLWERADPDLQPRVAEARRRLVRLADREPAPRP